MTIETETQETTNGIDVNALNHTVDAITDTKEIATFNFRTHNRWIEGAHSRSAIKGFYGAGNEDTSRTQAFVYDADAPPVMLGKNKGPNPPEFLLHALASCLTTTLVFHAAARGIELTEIESTIEGKIDLRGFLGIDDSIRNGYQSIEVNITVEGDASRETLDELIEIAKQRSVVLDTISNTTPVEIKVTQTNN